MVDHFHPIRTSYMYLCTCQGQVSVKHCHLVENPVNIITVKSGQVNHRYLIEKPICNMSGQVLVNHCHLIQYHFGPCATPTLRNKRRKKGVFSNLTKNLAEFRATANAQTTDLRAQIKNKIENATLAVSIRLFLESLAIAPHKKNAGASLRKRGCFPTVDQARANAQPINQGDLTEHMNNVHRPYSAFP